MNSKEYSKSRGYPLMTLRRLIHEGIIPAEKIGNRFVIRVELADQILEQRALQNLGVEKKEAQSEYCAPPNHLSFTDKIKHLKKQLKTKGKKKPAVG